MSEEMNTEELIKLHDELADLLARGDEDGARALIGKEMSRLPEEMRNELLGRMFLEEIVNEAEENGAIAQVQEEGIAAIEALQLLKKELEKQGNKETRK